MSSYCSWAAVGWFDVLPPPVEVPIKAAGKAVAADGSPIAASAAAGACASGLIWSVSVVLVAWAEEEGCFRAESEGGMVAEATCIGRTLDGI